MIKEGLSTSVKGVYQRLQTFAERYRQQLNRSERTWLYLTRSEIEFYLVEVSSLLACEAQRRRKDTVSWAKQVPKEL
jgi:hypothetical protein